MDRDRILAMLKAQESELRASGVESLSLFGSVARGEPAAHDLDIAVRLGDHFSPRGLKYFSWMENFENRLSRLIGCKVDVVEEPVRKKRFQTEIDRDRALVF